MSAWNFEPALVTVVTWFYSMPHQALDLPAAAVCAVLLSVCYSREFVRHACTDWWLLLLLRQINFKFFKVFVKRAQNARGNLCDVHLSLGSPATCLCCYHIPGQPGSTLICQYLVSCADVRAGRPCGCANASYLKQLGTCAASRRQACGNSR